MQENLNKKYYKADELANILGIKKFVIRTWESQFGLNRSNTQYSQEDLILFKAIRELLYEKKLSLTVAKQQLPELLTKKIKEVQEFKIEPESVLQVEKVVGNEVENSVGLGTIEPVVEIQTEAAKEVELVVQPAFKENEEFWSNLKNFKEQLLKIHNKLK